MSDLIRANPNIRLRFGTAISDDFNCNDRQTVVPLETVKRRVGQLMAGSGLAGWAGVIELQAVSNSYANVGRDILGHIHFLLWTHDAAFDLDGLEARLAASSRLHCASGAPTVVFTGAETDAAPIEERLRWARSKVWYMAKLPAHAKNIVHRHGKRPKAFGCTPRGDLAVRLLEILSRLRMDELIMGSGEGRSIVDSVRKALRERAIYSDWRALDSEVAEFWAFARRINDKELYQPVLVERWRHNERTESYKRGPYLITSRDK